MAWIGFVLSLMVAQHAASQSLAAIHQVLMKSEECGSSIIIKLSGNPAYKVIGIGKREILIALKDTELSKELCNKEITGDGLMQRIEISKKPNNVSCLLVKLRKPYIGIDDQIEASKGRLRVQVTSTASSTKKTLKPSKTQSPKCESPPPLHRRRTSTMPGTCPPVSGRGRRLARLEQVGRAPDDLPVSATHAGTEAAHCTYRWQAGGRRSRSEKSTRLPTLARGNTCSSGFE